MAIIGYKRVGWSKDKNKRFELLISFDIEKERDLFEKIIDNVQEFSDLNKERK